MRKIINVGIAGEEIEKGLFKTVYMARNGVFEEKNSWMGRHIYKASNYIFSNLNSIPEMEPLVELSDKLPKLPLEAFSAAYNFYKEVCDLNGQEAQINFYINDKGVETITVDNEVLILKDIPGVKYWTNVIFSYVPVQENSSGLTRAVDPIYTAIRRVTKPFIETHSHNTMRAFKSGTDAANSLNEGLQLVFGKLGSDTTYDFDCWATIGGTLIDDIESEELEKFIDLPEELGVVSDLLDTEVPEEWIKQCKFTESRVITSYGYYGGYNYNSQSNSQSRRRQKEESWDNYNQTRSFRPTDTKVYPNKGTVNELNFTLNKIQKQYPQVNSANSANLVSQENQEDQAHQESRVDREDQDFYNGRQVEFKDNGIDSEVKKSRKVETSKNETSKNETKDNVKIAIDSTLPGPVIPVGQVNGVIFYGEVSEDEFISAKELSDSIGLKEGKIFESEKGEGVIWLKYEVEENRIVKTLYTPKHPIRTHLAWSDIYRAGAVYGDGEEGGDATVEIEGHTYKVRLMRTTNPSKCDPRDLIDSKSPRNIHHGGEWNRLILPLIDKDKHLGWSYIRNVSSDISNSISHKFGTGETGYTASDLGIPTTNSRVRGGATLMQERVGRHREVFIRGTLGADFMDTQNMNISLSHNGWRPVIEVVKASFR